MLFHLRTSWAPDFLEGAPQFYFYLFIYIYFLAFKTQKAKQTQKLTKTLLNRLRLSYFHRCCVARQIRTYLIQIKKK